MKRGHRKGRFTKENASRLGKMGAAVREEKRLRRMAEGWVDDEPQRVPDGQMLGVLTWQAADGTMRRWVITQGPRANNIGVLARLVGADGVRRVMGWDKLMAGLRKRLSVSKRVLRSPYEPG